MQTFLPYADFRKSAQSLDYKRLGKQRVETWQILRAIRGVTKGWQNHPASIMWRDNEQALIQYGIVVCEEWIARGYRDTMLERFTSEVQDDNPTMPPWLGFDKFHTSHQSNLVRKDPNFYRFNVENNLPYVWFNADGTHYEGIRQ